MATVPPPDMLASEGEPFVTVRAFRYHPATALLEVELIARTGTVAAAGTSAQPIAIRLDVSITNPAGEKSQIEPAGWFVRYPSADERAARGTQILTGSVIWSDLNPIGQPISPPYTARYQVAFEFEAGGMRHTLGTPATGSLLVDITAVHSS